MTDSAHMASHLARAAFSPFFGPSASFEAFPPLLGSEVFKTIRARMKAKGLPDADHAQEVFSRSLIKCLEHLNKHGAGSVRHLRSWFHAVAHYESARYLMEVARIDAGAVLSIEEGKTDLLDSTQPEKIEEIVRQAMAQLPPRYRQFIELDLIGRLSPAEIEKSMGINSHAYFLKLKCAAFSGLRSAICKLLETSIEASL